MSRYAREVSETGVATTTDLRVLIAGGGTGGHLFPGVALAQQVLAQGGEVSFVGTDRGIEARVIPGLGWDLDLVSVAGIKGGGLAGLVRGLTALPGAFVQSVSILRRRRPSVVVGVGGYASGPVVATASLLGIPTAILEQNSVPGVTNKILGRMVRRIFTTFPDVRGDFPSRKLRRLGNPIREEILTKLSASHDNGRRPDDRGPRLLVFGGSQGARALNLAMIEAAPALCEAVPGLEIWHQTGRAMRDEVRSAYDAAGLDPSALRVSAFIEDMAEAYRWCDVALCRAGATSLAELAVVGCPAILVPFPHAADNHQEHNAQSLVEAGGARLLLERDLSPVSLREHVGGLLTDREAVAEMSRRMRDAGHPDAGPRVLAELVQLSSGGR